MTIAAPGEDEKSRQIQAVFVRNIIRSRAGCAGKWNVRVRIPHDSGLKLR